jgi:hypothetical protein
VLLNYDQDDAEDKIVITGSSEDICTLVWNKEEAQHYEASWPKKLHCPMIVSALKVVAAFKRNFIYWSIRKH